MGKPGKLGVYTIVLFIFVFKTLHFELTEHEVEIEIPTTSNIVMEKEAIFALNRKYNLTGLNMDEHWYVYEAITKCPICNKKYQPTHWGAFHYLKNHIIPSIKPNYSFYSEFENELSFAIKQLDSDNEKGSIIRMACIDKMVNYFNIKDVPLSELLNYCSEFKYIWEKANIHPLYKLLYNALFGALVLCTLAFYFADLVDFLNRKYIKHYHGS